MYHRLFNQPYSRNKMHAFFKAHFNSQAIPFVRVNTIDHDGCFGLRYMEPYEVTSMHAPIIAAFNGQKKLNGYNVDYIMSYSNRQSIRRDCLNAIHNQNNLAFPVATALANAVGAYFDPLLLADIYAGKTPGFTIAYMKLALSKIGLTLKNKISDDVLIELLNKNTVEYIFSEDKINILYAQIHRMALIHPKSIIHFHIYDDLFEQVLQPSSTFYVQYPDLIPANVTLYFHYFNTLKERIPLPMNIYPITGKGKIDMDYYKTVILMGEIAKKEEGNHISTYKMANYLSPKKILEALPNKNLSLNACNF